MDFPLWFGAVARLYETYEFTKVRIHLISPFSTFTSGLVTLSFNNNPTDTPPVTAAEMLQQLGARQTHIARNLTIDIPPSVWRQTPSRRFTYGVQSYSFDIDVLTESVTTGQFTLIIEYGVTFHTPQTRPSESAIATATFTATTQRGQSTTPGSVSYSIGSQRGATGLGVELQPGQGCTIAANTTRVDSTETRTVWLGTQDQLLARSEYTTGSPANYGGEPASGMEIYSWVEGTWQRVTSLVADLANTSILIINIGRDILRVLAGVFGGTGIESRWSFVTVDPATARQFIRDASKDVQPVQ